MANYRVELIVRPRPGVRDPQGRAVQEALGAIGFSDSRVEGVGRFLQMAIEADSPEQARSMVDDMCRRLLVNPNLETYQLSVEPA